MLDEQIMQSMRETHPVQGLQRMPAKSCGPIGCGDSTGCLPACAPLANPYVPFQRRDPEKYKAPRALIRGTLFPGLDLPFMGVVNRSEKDGPLGELMALNFAMHELGLYLDTHQDDAEAAELFAQYAKLYREGREQYEKQYGALRQENAVREGKYTWLTDPWPWDYVEGGK